MLDPSLSEIAARIEPLCRRLEGEMFSGRDAETIDGWARYNAQRHAHTIRSILDWARAKGRRRLRIFNAGGMSIGHQDFSLAEVLPECLEELRLTAIEHPDSQHLGHPLFQSLVDHYGIEILQVDVAEAGYPSDQTYDVVLFTEIAEHLEHAVLLRAFESLRALTAPDGLLLLTTPNMASAMNRLKLLTRGELPYWGDEAGWLERFEWGHLALYTPARMTRLAESCGWHLLDRTSFSCGEGGRPRPLVRRLPRWAITQTLGRLRGAGDTMLLQLTPNARPRPAAPQDAR